MKIKFKDISINLENFENTEGQNDIVLFIHGFTGSSKDWGEILPLIDSNYKTLAIDLIGHGKSDSPDDENYYTQDSLVEQIDFAIRQLNIKKIILAGYSMGGRVALSYAARYPEKVKGLILESASTGISSEEVRQQRIKYDLELAEFIKNNSFEKFVDHWMNIDLFKSQKSLPNETLKKVRDNKLSNNKAGISNSLKGFSTGKMQPLINSLKNINAKTILITGELDQKFTSINSEMVNHLPAAEHKIVENAGHNVHLEKRGEFILLVNNFLKQF